MLSQVGQSTVTSVPKLLQGETLGGRGVGVHPAVRSPGAGNDRPDAVSTAKAKQGPDQPGELNGRKRESLRGQAEIWQGKKKNQMGFYKKKIFFPKETSKFFKKKQKKIM